MLKWNERGNHFSLIMLIADGQIDEQADRAVGELESHFWSVLN